MKHSKLEQQMAATMEDLAKQFERFQLIMHQTLDDWSHGVERWTSPGVCSSKKM
jgi:hypothetical protein